MRGALTIGRLARRGARSDDHRSGCGPHPAMRRRTSDSRSSVACAVRRRGPTLWREPAVRWWRETAMPVACGREPIIGLGDSGCDTVRGVMRDHRSGCAPRSGIDAARARSARGPRPRRATPADEAARSPVCVRGRATPADEAARSSVCVRGAAMPGDEAPRGETERSPVCVRGTAMPPDAASD